MPSKRASLIIAVYNGSAYLGDCLASLRQNIRAEDEIILVDNASSDGGVEAAQLDWPGFKLIRNPANAGYAAACNQGAEQAAGEFLVLLNQDTQVCPGWLSSLLKPLQQDPTIGLTTSRLLLMSQPDRLNMCGQNIHFTGFSFGRGFLHPAGSFPEPARVGAVTGAAFAIRRELWQELGGFDENLFMYYEDTDLSWRALLSGFDCLYVPDSAAYHDYRPAQPGYLALYHTKRNRLVLLLKTWRWRTLLLLFPSLLMAEALDWLHSALTGRRGLSAKLRASAWLFTHLPLVLRSRGQSQKRRKVNDLALLERCVDRLNPVEFTGGKFGRRAVSACSALFHLNAEIARGFCHLFEF
jgi:GT2 family glycosyltransferase